MGMSIDLRYDSAMMLTTVAIDGNVVDGSDIYGFLYPVRHRLMQAWLMPSGSWAGLARQIQELSRGESTTLTFSGREVDFHDLKRSLATTENVDLRFEPWDVASSMKEQLLKAKKQIEGVVEKEVLVEQSSYDDVFVTMDDTFPEVACDIRSKLASLEETSTSWCERVEGDQDFKRVANGNTCVVISPEYLTGFSRLESLRRLTRSLRRAQEMVVCEFSSLPMREDFESYAKQMGMGDMGFVMRGECGWQDRLREKYGDAIVLRRQLTILQEVFALFQDKCLGQKLDEQCNRWVTYVKKDIELLGRLLDENASVADTSQMNGGE